ncbi:MAG: hypothetical protein EOO63_02395 [Hymenobacter sp.]|nr:MAG: hypothetical protein EOO63_02395 [Hymenobacter sp.]
MVDAGCRISRAGRGRATDNVFSERCWPTVKWEHVYLTPAEGGHHLHQQLHTYFAYSNQRRPHQSWRRPTSTERILHSTITLLLNKPP